MTQRLFAVTRHGQIIGYVDQVDTHTAPVMSADKPWIKKPAAECESVYACTQVLTGRGHDGIGRSVLTFNDTWLFGHVEGLDLAKAAVLLHADGLYIDPDRVRDEALLARLGLGIEWTETATLPEDYVVHTMATRTVLPKSPTDPILQQPEAPICAGRPKEKASDAAWIAANWSPKARAWVKANRQWIEATANHPLLQYDVVHKTRARARTRTTMDKSPTDPILQQPEAPIRAGRPRVNEADAAYLAANWTPKARAWIEENQP